MSNKSRERERRRRKAQRAALRPDLAVERTELHESARLPKSNEVHSTGDAQKRATVSENFMWAAIAAILGLAVTLAWNPAENWYHRPRLEIQGATAILVPHSQEENGTIKNYAVLYDTGSACSVVGYHMFENGAGSEPWSELVEVDWKLLLHNAGHSPLTNLSFSVDSSQASEVSAASSPNLVIDQPLQDGTPGAYLRVATIREIAPGESGILTVRAFAGSGVLSVTELPQDGRVSLAISNPSIPVGLRFEGSGEMKSGDAHFELKPMLDLLQDESSLEGDSMIRIPFVRKVHLNSTVGIPSNWNFAFIRMTGGESCPNAAKYQFRLVWPVVISPKGSRSAQN